MRFAGFRRLASFPGRANTLTTAWVFLSWVAVALAFRATVAIVAGPALARAEGAGFAEDGSAYYLPLARSLWEGQGFLNTSGEPSAHHMPGYPLLITAARWVTPSFPAAILTVQVLFGSLAVGFVFLLSASLFSRRAAHASAAVALVWPDLVIFGLLNLSDTPFLCVTLCGAWILGRLLDRGRPGLAILLGLLCGFGTLLRESMISFTGAWVLAVLLLPGDRSPWRRALNGLLLIATMCLVLVPWWVRNAATFGEFIPLTTKGAGNIYVGTLIRPYYFSDARNDAVPLEPAARAREEAVTARAHEARSSRDEDRILLGAALDNVRRAPLEQLAHLGRKTYWLWQPNIGPRHADRVGMAPVLWLIAVSHWLLVLAGLAGLWLLRRDRRAVLTLALPFLVVTLFHAVVGIGEPRYHLPLVPILIVAAAPVLLRLVRRETAS